MASDSLFHPQGKVSRLAVGTRCYDLKGMKEWRK